MWAITSLISLYGRASRQLASFHMYLDRACRFLVSDDACERITDEELRDGTSPELILAFMEMHHTELDTSETKNTNSRSL